MNTDIVLDFIRSRYPKQDRIALHEPRFRGNEKKYLADTIDSTFVSSVGEYVTRFESMLSALTGAKHAVVTVNGTTALHMGLVLVGVNPGDLVLTQALSFVATSNAIAHAGAEPIFVDIDRMTLGMDPGSLHVFLQENAERRSDGCFDKTSGRRYAACVPMHTFGHPCRIDALVEICAQFGIPLVEDAAEALGSLWRGKHCGTFGLLGTLSFNGNKIITCGGGGAIITDDANIAARAKQLTTTAKKPHAWLFEHECVAYNYRMPNLNAALGCAQLEQLDSFLEDKRLLASEYEHFCAAQNISFMVEPPESRANYWLNAIFVEDQSARDAFLALSNAQSVQTRPVWSLLPLQPMFMNCRCADISIARNISETLVNIPSSVR